MLVRLRLNAVRLEILEFVKHGHNVMITGQGGVGKSEVVKSIVSSLNATGKKVGVVCSSGIATQVYDKGVASTVHSFYGLQTAELPSDKLIERSIESDVVRVRVEAVDSVIWDEASMSSQRMLELANALHHRLSDEDSSSFPFAGKQIVLVGEFLQLRPVPNCFDDGNFMFMSRLYCSAISHRFELTELMRQSEADEMFLSALKEVRLGECSGATEDYLGTLSRDLDEEKERSATHIFFKKIPALLFNRSVLSQQPGVLYTFNAVAEKEDDNKMNWPGQSVLHLKVGCRVMLVWNKSPQLKNGTMGVFCGMENEMLRIDFPGVGTVSISRETWVRRNRRGDKVGSITQYPIVLAYGITCHKAQGLTLPSAIVHCSTEFVPGLIYVAASRVKDAGDLQLLNFNRKQLLKPTPKVIEQCSTAHTSDPCADLSCCRRKILNDATLFNVSDRFSEENEGDEYFTFPIEMFDGPAQASFNEEESLIPLEMNDLFLRVDKCESIISSPPSDLKPPITEVLAGLKVKETSEFAIEENRAIDSLLATGQSKLHAFLKIIWFHSFLLIKSYITENSGNAAGELLVDISRQAFTDATASLNELWCSQDFARYVCGLFETTKFSAPQKTVAVKVGREVFLSFLKHLSSVVRQDQQDDDISFDVESMPAVGKAKVRYVGGWAIRKVLETLRKSVKRNMFSLCSDTIAKVHKRHVMCELLEESIIIPYSKLEETTNLPETLQVTEERQFRERGLIHISDEAYKFFMCLEGRRVSLLNLQTMTKQKDMMVEVVKTQLKSDEALKEKWAECFSTTDAAVHKVRFLYLFCPHNYLNIFLYL